MLPAPRDSGATGRMAAWSLVSDVSASGAPVTTYVPCILLGVALPIALGFEFVNGFHGTANAVATVIYTHSPAPNVAVVWSGLFNTPSLRAPWPAQSLSKGVAPPDRVPQEMPRRAPAITPLLLF
jgi:hypothetical protein